MNQNDRTPPPSWSDPWEGDDRTLNPVPRGKQPLAPEREDDDRDDTSIKRPRGPRLRREPPEEPQVTKRRKRQRWSWSSPSISPFTIVGDLLTILGVVVVIYGLTMDTTTSPEATALAHYLNGSRPSLLDGIAVHNTGLLHKSLVTVIVGVGMFVSGLLSLGIGAVVSALRRTTDD